MCGDFAPGYPLVLVSLAWRSDWAVAVAIAHSIHALWNTLWDIRKLFKQLEDIVVLVRGQFVFAHTHTHTQFVENDIPCVDLCFLMLSPIVLVSGYWSCQHFDIVQSQGQMTKLNRVTVGAMVTLDVHARDEAQASCMCSWM